MKGKRKSIGRQESDEIVVLGGNGGELEIQPDSWRNFLKDVYAQDKEIVLQGRVG